MGKTPENLYQLKNALALRHKNYYTPKIAETFIRTVTCAFAEKNYFREREKNRYHYTEDFANLILTLAELNISHDSLHTYLLHCEKCSISYKDMEHFLYLLLNNQNSFSLLFVERIRNVLSILHFLTYNSKSYTYITDEKNIKKNLLFYIIAKNNHSRIKITNDLTISELQKKLSGDKPCEL